MIRITDPDQVGPALRQLRTILGISQRELCEISGQRQGRMSAWELGHEVPRFSSLVRMVRALGYDLVLVPREDAL